MGLTESSNPSLFPSLIYKAVPFTGHAGNDLLWGLRNSYSSGWVSELSSVTNKMTKGIYLFNYLEQRKKEKVIKKKYLKRLILETNKNIIQRAGISIFPLMWSFSSFRCHFCEVCYFWKRKGWAKNHAI